MFSDDLAEGLDAVRDVRPDLVRSEIERVHTARTTSDPRSPSAALSRPPLPWPPPWIRRLHQGDADAWQVLRRAQHAAFEAVVRPVWGQVQGLHRTEFTRHALRVAEHGIGAALTDLTPGAQLRDEVWEFEGPAQEGPAQDGPGQDGPGHDGPGHDIKLRGRGVLLLPTFYRTGRPLANLPSHPLVVTFLAGPGLPLVPPAPRPGGTSRPAGTDDTGEALAGKLGRSRADLLVQQRTGTPDAGGRSNRGSRTDSGGSGDGDSRGDRGSRVDAQGTLAR